MVRIYPSSRRRIIPLRDSSLGERLSGLTTQESRQLNNAAPSPPSPGRATITASPRPCFYIRLSKKCPDAHKVPNFRQFSHSLSGLFLCSDPFLHKSTLTFSTEPHNKPPPIWSPMKALFHGQHAIWPGTRLVRWCCLAIRTDTHSHGNFTRPWGNKKE